MTKNKNQLISVGTQNSLAIQWLGLSTFTPVAWVPSLIRKLRSCKPCCEVKNK